MVLGLPSIRSKPLNLVFEIPNSKTLRFWELLEEGEFQTTRCKVCGLLYFPPIADCPECTSSDMEWVELDDHGEVEAFTHIIARPLSFQNKEPYTVAIARLRDGVKVLAWLKDAEVTDVEIGMKVKLKAGVTSEGDVAYWFIPEI